MRPLPALVRTIALCAATLSAIAIGACGDFEDVEPGPADAGTADAGAWVPPVTVCEGTFAEAEFSGTSANLTIDTSEALEHPRDLGLGCNNDESYEWAPQSVVRLTIPGTGPKTLTVNTKTNATARKFATIVQLREACEVMPVQAMPPRCYSSLESSTDLRVNAKMPVEGGQTYFLIVTGYSDIPLPYFDRGVVQLDLKVADADRPALDLAAVVFVGPDVEASGRVADGNKDIAGLVATFLDADGKILDLDGNGVGNEGDAIAGAFAGSTGKTSFTGTIVSEGNADLLRKLGAKQAVLRAWDATYGVSEPATVDIDELDRVGVGAACSADIRCARPLSCEASVCKVTGPQATVCDALAPLRLSAPTGDVATKVTASGTLRPGASNFSASCGDTSGREVAFAVDVPEGGPFDLVADNGVTGTQEVDTMVYVRSTCGDPTTEVTCNDDPPSGDPRGRATVYAAPVGRYAIFVEYNGGIPDGQQLPFKLAVSLRPVLETGATCDPTEVKNRCARAHCMASKVCP